MSHSPGETMIDRQRLAERIEELGRTITRDYQDRDLVVVVILKGSFIFAADLVRAIDLPMAIEFIGVSSYTGTASTGHVRLTTDLTTDVMGRDLLLIEDIVDTGRTLKYLQELLQVRRPNSLKIATMLSKPDARVVACEPDYVGFEIKNEFVVGYGLDLDQKYRALPEIRRINGDDA